MKTKSLDEVRDEIEKQLQNLNPETLKLLAEDHKKAEEYIEIGRKVSGGKKLDADQIEMIANEMQNLARLELKQRMDK